MSLKSKNVDKRIFYYSEKPLDINYPFTESFYFRILEFDNKKSIEYVKIEKISFVDQIDNISNTQVLFEYPNIPNSISKAVNEIENLL
jgi:hypothetical protein